MRRTTYPIISSPGVLWRLPLRRRFRCWRSYAIEFKAEGFVTGMAAKMFVIAGPVIVYGTLASVVYGVVLWALG